MNTLKQRLTDWYNRRITAKWYESSAMWVGVLAGLVQYLPGWLQMLLDQWDLASSVLALTADQKIRIQGILLFVVLPIAKAWRQERMTVASLKQVAERTQNAPENTP